MIRIRRIRPIRNERRAGVGAISDGRAVLAGDVRKVAPALPGRCAGIPGAHRVVLDHGVGLYTRLVVGSVRREIHFERVGCQPAQHDARGIERLVAVVTQDAAIPQLHLRHIGSRAGAAVIDAGDVAIVVLAGE